MNGATVEISRRIGEISPKRTCLLEESLERLCRSRWPARTAVFAAAEWDLTRDEAREVVRGRASKAVLNKIAQHRRGGLPVMLKIMERSTGQTIAQLNAAKRERAFRVIEEADDFDFRPRGDL